ncbi:MAG: YtxH domain-containing protein [Dissulfuribacterales bacterium]
MDHNENCSSSIGGLFAAFLVGGIVGAAVAVLFAPRSGEETREKLREKAAILKENMEDMARDVRDKTYQAVEKGRELLEEQKGRFSSAIDAGKEAMLREKERLMSKFNESVEDLEEA